MKVVIKGTGQQAPYGIGEIMYILPWAHYRKILGIVRRYHTPPTLHCDRCDRELRFVIDEGDGAQEEICGIEECCG